MSPYKPLLILHLSDLHFGPHSRFVDLDKQRLARGFADDIDKARRDLAIAEPVGLIIATGDIAEAGMPDEYQDATTFFAGLVGVLGLGRERVLFVPGNHDICWDICEIEERRRAIRKFDHAELERRIQDVKLEFYREFVTGFYGRKQGELPDVTSLGNEAFIHSFPDDHLQVAILNSCEKESHRAEDHIGVFGQTQAQALMKVWRKREAQSWLKIAAIHHNPVATVPEGVKSWVAYLKQRAGEKTLDAALVDRFVADAVRLDGAELLERVASDCEVPLVLHGHHHASARGMWPWQGGQRSGHTYVLSAGSWGLQSHKLPEGQPLVMHLIHLDPAARQGRSILRRYEPRARRPGDVEPGVFTVDPADENGCPLTLSLPAGRPDPTPIDPTPIPDGRQTAQEAKRTADFVREYRVRLAKRYLRWELGAVGTIATTGSGRPVTATLDDMYLPLRLAEGYSIDTLDQGKPIGPAELVELERPLVIRGPAGSGKTTWMRWTFRRLIEAGHGALPFMVELRRLARVWGEVQPGDRSIDAYLRDWLSESGMSGWSGDLTDILRSSDAPRPVLLVDGWDELGDLGGELREKLVGFMNAHERVVVVVTSRPYGESQPSHAEGFDALDIQPLADGEIAVFADRFFRTVHGEEEPVASDTRDRFMQALDRSAETASLARTALLLTMMLLISRNEPLPDKRHTLYQKCLENLLTARPDRREQEGAQLGCEQHRPDNSDERFRMAAQLAHSMQTDGYGESRGRELIVATWDDLADLLPDTWERKQRRGFIAWLAGAAGVLVDRADGTLAFTHLSFQEYLCAWHLHVRDSARDEDRLALCRKYMASPHWWETLRLWAALIDSRDPTQLNAAGRALISGEASGFWLVGAMLADGAGEESLFATWLEALAGRFQIAASDGGSETSASAWAASRQAERRLAIERAWPRMCTGWTWLEWLFAREWYLDAGIEAEHGVSAESSSMATARSRVVYNVVNGALGDEASVSLSRVLMGAHPLWPLSPPEYVLLRLWPAHRALAATRLQTMLSLGASRDEASTAPNTDQITCYTAPQQTWTVDSRQLPVDSDPVASVGEEVDSELSTVNCRL